MASKFIMYHNPKCSKSRQCLEVLESKTKDYQLIEYIKVGLSRQELTSLWEFLGDQAEKLIRSNDPLITEIGLKLESREQIIDALIAHPKLLQRPILVKNNQSAIIARPPADILSFLQD
jgi:arsenate reductase